MMMMLLFPLTEIRSDRRAYAKLLVLTSYESFADESAGRKVAANLIERVGREMWKRRKSKS